MCVCVRVVDGGYRALCVNDMRQVHVSVRSIAYVGAYSYMCMCVMCEILSGGVAHVVGRPEIDRPQN